MTLGRNGQTPRELSLEAQLELAHARIFELEAQLRKNPLTGLTSRYGFEEIKTKLGEFIADKNFTGNGCYVGIDLDGFKGVNDTHGHDVGDKVLQHFASRLAEKMKEYESHADRVPVFAEAIHPSGDEYGILVVEAVSQDVRSQSERRKSSREYKQDRRGNPNRLEEEIAGVMQEMINELELEPLMIESANGPIYVTHGVSFGIGRFSHPDPESIRIAEKDADKAMFQKKSGQAAFINCFEEMDPEIQRFALEIMGERALHADTNNPDSRHNSIGLSAYYLDDRLSSLIEALDDEALKWVFPEMAPSRNKQTQDLSL